jgi:type I restriction enzyme, S subunit
MTNWKPYKFSELVNIIGGGTPKTSVSEYWNGSIPWLSVVDFGGHRKTVYTTEKSITEKGLKESSTKILKKGQLIISARGTVGEIAVLGRDMAFNQSCYGLVAKPDLATNDFLYYLLKYKIESLKSVAHGSVFDTITRQTFEQLQINLPSLPTQQRIAGILSALDDKIELNRRMNQTLEQMAQTLFRQYFVDGIDEGKLPEGWRKGKIGEIYKTTSGGTPSRAKSGYYGGHIPWVKSKELNGNFILHTEESITETGLKGSSAKLLPAYSVLVAMYGATVGEIAVLNIEATCNQAICAIIPNERFPYTFIFEFLKLAKEDLINRASGSAQQNISQVVIQNFDLLIPPVNLIADFHEKVKLLNQKIISNEKENKYLTQLRHTLLPKLMSGEIDVMQTQPEALHEPVLS